MDTIEQVGLALVRPLATDSKVLLVRTANSNWALPITAEGETLQQLLEMIKTDLLPSSAAIDVRNELLKHFEVKEGNVPFQLAAVDADLNPYFESERYIDARWASFDEAFHIARLDLEAVVRWSERQAQKQFEI